MQERLLPAMKDEQVITQRAMVMLQCANAMDIPVLVTEQYPNGLGSTVEPIRSLTNHAQYFEKTKFAAPEPVTRAAKDMGRTQLLVLGVEAHVCVQQTALECLAAGFDVGILTDACGSRRAADKDPGIRRMVQAGAQEMTVESAIFEIVGDASHQTFRKIRGFIK